MKKEEPVIELQLLHAGAHQWAKEGHRKIRARQRVKVPQIKLSTPKAPVWIRNQPTNSASPEIWDSDLRSA
eukprot:scaffold163907_cov18-Tisochrysis_lutea.AAC.2